tara:strand:- start:1299 stop:1937 length:639 start_codon:yes stop_codon:yes gene_type:complete
MNVQNDIIICTTAVDRPELHKNTFTKYLDFLDGCNFHWMIHLNNVWSNYVHSMNMIRDLLQDKSYEIIFSSDGGKNIDFFNAGKKLIETCTDHESKYGVLWLEDDWEYIGNDKLIDILDDYDYLQLVERNKEMSFNPGVFSWDVVKNIMQPNMKRTGYKKYNDNPERTALFKDDEDVSFSVENHVVKPNFRDIGREWMAREHNGKRVFNINV